MISFPDIPAVRIHPTPSASFDELRIDVLPRLAPHAALGAEMDRAWDLLRQTGVRLHDGPILLAETDLDEIANSSFTAAPVRLPRIAARRATYKSLATAHLVGANVRALGVQGVVTGRDQDGDEHLLLGRRGSEVRIYQGLWENAPSGTIIPPPPAETTLTGQHFIQALLDEGVEELGLNLSDAQTSWIALLDDAEARSLDVVLKLELPGPINPRALPCATGASHRWEYADTAWVPIAQLPIWATQHAHAISPPTRVVIQWCFDSP